MSTNYHYPIEPAYRTLPRDSRPQKLSDTVPIVYESDRVGVAQLHDLGHGPLYVYELHDEFEEKMNKGLLHASLCFEAIDPPLDTGENLRATYVRLFDKDPDPKPR